MIFRASRTLVTKNIKNYPIEKLRYETYFDTVKVKIGEKGSSVQNEQCYV